VRLSACFFYYTALLTLVRFLLDCTTHGFLINLFIKPLSNTCHSHLILMDLFVCFHDVCTSWWENAQVRLTMPQVFILQLFYLALLLQLIIEGVLVNILIYQTVDLEFVLLNLQLQSGYHDKHIDYKRANLDLEEVKATCLRHSCFSSFCLSQLLHSKQE
jgi:hypothetical protein